MSGIRCSACGRDLDEIGQVNMSYTREPLCEDCWNGDKVAQQGHRGTSADAFAFEVSVDPEKIAESIAEGIARSVRDTPFPAAGYLQMTAM